MEVQDIPSYFSIKKGLENFIQTYEKMKYEIHKTKDAARKRQETDRITEIEKRTAGLKGSI